jgi:histidyl-tRNA synthetase
MYMRRVVERKLRAVVETYGYREIATPTFEHVELFTLKSGNAIVDQMYTFADKSGRAIALRPELTAPVMRYYSTELLSVPKPIKVYYFGNCFRYERTQKGRFREFWQFGVELIGGMAPEADAELIALAVNALKTVGIRNFTVRIGHLAVLEQALEALAVTPTEQTKLLRLIDKGEFDEVNAYLDAQGCVQTAIDSFMKLVSMCGSRTSVLSELRASPAIAETFGKELITEGIDKLDAILEFLEAGGVRDYIVDLGIARGLDYYTGMVFEIDVPTLGAEKQVCGGGTYVLSDVLGIPQVNTTGFAMGFDRIVMALEADKYVPKRKRLRAYVVTVSDDSKLRKKAFELVSQLRGAGIDADIDLSRRSLDKSLRYANTLAVEYVVIVGEDELAKGEVSVKNMDTGEQRAIALDKLPDVLK